MSDENKEINEKEMQESKRRAERIKEVKSSFDADKDSDIAKMLAEIEAKNKKTYG